MSLISFLIVEHWQLLLPITLFALIFCFLKRSTGNSDLDLDDDINSNIPEKITAEQKTSSVTVKKRNQLPDDESEENENEYENHGLQPFLEDKEHVPYAGASIYLNGGAEEFYQIANDRRSVRKYSRTRLVDRKTIENCILAAGTGPSGAHTEPWTFCLIESADVKQQIREIIEAEELLNYTQRMSRQWTTDLQPLKTNHIKEYLTDAPYLILVFKQTYGILPNGKKQTLYYNEISVSISVGILLSAIQCAGLSSLITTPLNCGPALRQLLNRPINEKLQVLLPVGFPADDCLVPDLQRKNLNDILVKY